MGPTKPSIPNLQIPRPICVAGGTGLSRQYLTVLVHHIPERLPFYSMPWVVDSRIIYRKQIYIVGELASCTNINHEQRFHLLGHFLTEIVSVEVLRKRGDIVWLRCTVHP